MFVKSAPAEWYLPVHSERSLLNALKKQPRDFSDENQYNGNLEWVHKSRVFWAVGIFLQGQFDLIYWNPKFQNFREPRAKSRNIVSFSWSDSFFQNNSKQLYRVRRYNYPIRVSSPTHWEATGSQEIGYRFSCFIVKHTRLSTKVS